MDAVLRAAAIYISLMLLIRLIGNRPLAQATTFDLVLLIIIGETTQQALIGNSYSVVNAWLLIVTLLTMELLITFGTKRYGWVRRLSEAEPVVVLADGKPVADRMKHSGLDEGDILESARQLQGLERLDQIKYAVLERDGSVSIIPK